MKNKFLILSISLFINLFISSNLKSLEIFNFNATEIEITQDGNIFKGYKGGEAFTDDGVFIKAESFEFNKTTTLLVANGNVQLIDEKKDIVINADQISYLKNQETIIAIGNVKLDDKKKDVIIKANKISYYKNDEKIIANDNVQLKDNIRNIILNTNEEDITL